MFKSTNFSGLIFKANNIIVNLNRGFYLDILQFAQSKWREARITNLKQLSI